MYRICNMLCIRKHVYGFIFVYRKRQQQCIVEIYAHYKLLRCAHCLHGSTRHTRTHEQWWINQHTQLKTCYMCDVHCTSMLWRYSKRFVCLCDRIFAFVARLRMPSCQTLVCLFVCLRRLLYSSSFCCHCFVYSNAYIQKHTYTHTRIHSYKRIKTKQYTVMAARLAERKREKRRWRIKTETTWAR